MVSLKIPSSTCKLYRGYRKQKSFVAYDLLWRSGCFAKEENSFVIKNQIKFDNLSFNANRTPLLSIMENVNRLVEKSVMNTRRAGDFVYYKSKRLLTKSLLKKIKLEYINLKNLYNAAKNSQKLILPYLNENYTCAMIDEKPVLYRENDNIFVHPRDRLKNIIGETLDSDYEKMNLFINILNKNSLKELLKKKNDILKNIQASNISSVDCQDFRYSKNEMQRLKILATKYDMINNLLEYNGIFTKDIETLLFSNLKPDTKLGDILPNGDKILACTKTYDREKRAEISSIITFANTIFGYRFKTYAYNTSLISKISKYQKQYLYFSKLENIEAINNLNNKISYEINNSEIGEVYLEIADKNTMIKKMKEENLFSQNQIENLLNDDEKYYYIKNLKNFNINKFYNIAVPLIKCLKEFGNKNNIHKAFLEAQAFYNVKHSPIFLYLKMGCKPISHTREDIEKDIHNGYDYKKNVWLVYEM